MRMTNTRSNERFFLRTLRLTALGGSLALFACQDATSPDDAKAPELTAPSLTTSIGNANTPLAQVGANLVDATSWVLPSINNGGIRSSMKTALESMAANLQAAKYDLARQNWTTAKSLLSQLDAVDLVEVGPIDVSLTEVDAGLKKESY